MSGTADLPPGAEGLGAGAAPCPEPTPAGRRGGPHARGRCGDETLAAGSLAGWGAAACGVNLASLVVGEGLVPAGRPASAAGIATALALGGLGVATLPARTATPLQRVHGATLVWALVGVADGRRASSRPVAAAAVVAALPVLRRLR